MFETAERSDLKNLMLERIFFALRSDGFLPVLLPFTHFNPDFDIKIT
jgi:hypothetical protein